MHNFSLEMGAQLGAASRQRQLMAGNHRGETTVSESGCLPEGVVGRRLVLYSFVMVPCGTQF